MKKLLAILVLGLLWCGNVNAEEKFVFSSCDAFGFGIGGVVEINLSKKYMKGRFGEGGTFKKVQIKGEEGVYIVSKKFVVKRGAYSYNTIVTANYKYGEITQRYYSGKSYAYQRSGICERVNNELTTHGEARAKAKQAKKPKTVAKKPEEKKPEKVAKIPVKKIDYEKTFEFVDLNLQDKEGNAIVVVFKVKSSLKKTNKGKLIINSSEAIKSYWPQTKSTRTRFDIWIEKINDNGHFKLSNKELWDPHAILEIYFSDMSVKIITGNDVLDLKIIGPDKPIYKEETAIAKKPTETKPEKTKPKEQEKKKPKEQEKKKPKEQAKKEPQSSDINPDLITIGSGSGFYINNKGYALTNSHVIEICEQVITIVEGQKILFHIIANDEIIDIGLIKSTKKNSEYLSIESDGAKLGEDVIAVGYPLSDKLSDSVKITKGIVSSLSGIGNNTAQIQIDAALQPGNSGGPILNKSGDVVGIASAGLNKLLMAKEAKYIPENVNFAVATPSVVTFLKTKKIKYSTGSFFSKEYSTHELAEIGQESTIQLLCLNTRAAYAKLKRSKKYRDVLLDIN